MTHKQPWDNKELINEHQLIDLIESNCPPLKIQAIRQIGEGWDNTTWLINDIWCFRIPKRQAAVNLIKNEILILPHLPNLGVDHPRPEFICLSPNGYPFPFYGHRFLEGKTADYFRLSIDDREKLTIPIADFLKQLHAISIKKIQQLGIQHDPINKLNVEDRYSETKERLLYLFNHKIIDDISPFLILFKQNLSLKTPSKVVLGHGDFYARHLLLNNKKELTAIIDWGDCELMHPAIDLAIVYQFIPASSHVLFWRTYGEVDEVTKALAKLRAIYSATTLCWYADQVKDEALMAEGKQGLAFVNKILKKQK